MFNRRSTFAKVAVAKASLEGSFVTLVDDFEF